MSNQPIISPLREDIIHKICSGQVVVTLSSAVKELVENSIDAGATKIEIRLKEHGSEMIEVVDNGMGIKEDDFQAITGKHFTSKLRVYDDLEKVQTFGFRGEALSSLCHLAKVSIHTCSSEAAVGTRLEFNSDGTIASRRPLARSRGTTVTVQELFYSLPVRRRHMTDPGRVAKEFSKTINLLTAYCLISVGVQITCFKVSKTGEKTLVVSNGSSASVRSNVAHLFGQHQSNNLTDLSELERVPDDIMEEFNARCPTSSEDPIKLTGFISKLPTSCDQFITNKDSPKGRSTGRSSSDRQFIFVNGRPCDLPKISRLVTELWRRCSRESVEATTTGILMPISSIVTQCPVFILMLHMPTASVDVNLTPDKRSILLHHEKYILALVKATVVSTLTKVTGVHLASLSASAVNLDQSLISYSPLTVKRCQDSLVESAVLSFPEVSTPISKTKRSRFEDIGLTPDSTCAARTDELTAKPVQPTLRKPKMDVDLMQSNLPLLRDQSASAPFSLSRLRDVWRNRSAEASQNDTSGFSLSGFRSSQSDVAEAELSTYFSKSTFNRLRIIGQFNLGFIIARHRLDLFIIDQHASDEKFRFEQLCDTYRFTCQPLVVPQPLDLPVGQEQLLLNNLDVFAKSGFAFQVDPTAPCGKQVQLTATPMLEGKVFGRSDIDEMLFVLSESSSRRCRPSRLRDILASRSCRGAVMIGTALDRIKMERIVRNMGTMDHPWNCPHGRPTMRHLFHLGRLGNC